jgi:hypothetical protein
MAHYEISKRQRFVRRMGRFLALVISTLMGVAILPLGLAPVAAADASPGVVGVVGDAADLLRFNSDGTFNGGHSIKGSWGYELLTAVGDVDGDGSPDAVDVTRGVADLLHFQPSGDFDFGTRIGGTWNYRTITGIGDVDHDGSPDLLAVTDDGHAYRIGFNPEGSFRQAASLGAGWDYRTLAGVGDINHDGSPDVLAITVSDGVAYRMQFNSNGTWKNRVSLGSGWAGYQTLAGVGDLNNDGSPDALGVLNDGTGYRMQFNSDGSWKNRVLLSGSWGYDFILGIGDVDLTASPSASPSTRGVGDGGAPTTTPSSSPSGLASPTPIASPSAIPPPSPTYPSELGPGRSLGPDKMLMSPNGAYLLKMQLDGNLVLRVRSTGKVLWATGTDGNARSILLMQPRRQPRRDRSRVSPRVGIGNRRQHQLRSPAPRRRQSRRLRPGTPSDLGRSTSAPPKPGSATWGLGESN